MKLRVIKGININHFSLFHPFFPKPPFRVFSLADSLFLFLFYFFYLFLFTLMDSRITFQHKQEKLSRFSLV